MTREEAPAIECVERERLLKIYEDRFFELQKLKHLKENKGAEDRQLGVNYCINILREMPTVTPRQKMGRCKDCRRWKDSDGGYRRGVGAESQCPINCREVYEGNGYCFMYAPQEREPQETDSD
jgi:hypothetical protein